MAKFFKVCHEKRLVDNISKLLFEDVSSDVTFIIGNAQFKVHRIILAAQSPVFKAMLISHYKESKMTSIHLPNKEPQSFSLFLKYLYSGNLTFDNEFNLGIELKLLDLANEYGIQQLVDDVSHHLVDRYSKSFAKLDFETLLAIFERFFYYSEMVQPFLYDKLLQILNVNADLVIDTMIFYHLPLAVADFLLSHREFYLPTEKIHQAIQQWQKVNQNFSCHFKTMESSLVKQYAPIENMVARKHGTVISPKSDCGNADLLLPMELKNEIGKIIFKFRRKFLISSIRLSLGRKSSQLKLCLHCGYRSKQCLCRHTFTIALSTNGDEGPWHVVADFVDSVGNDSLLLFFNEMEISAGKNVLVA